MTLIERFKLDHPDNNGYSEEDVEECMIGCPRSYGYTTFEHDKDFCDKIEYDRNKYSNVCIACWNREIPEAPKAEPELKYEINYEEEEKMKNLRNLIVSKVDNAIVAWKIDNCIEEFVDTWNLDSEIDDLIETEIENTIEDYVGPILSEAVRDAVRKALDNLFS